MITLMKNANSVNKKGWGVNIANSGSSLCKQNPNPSTAYIKTKQTLPPIFLGSAF